MKAKSEKLPEEERGTTSSDCGNCAALLAELAAAHAVLDELRAVADAPGEDIRATIDAYFAKEYPHA